MLTIKGINGRVQVDPASTQIKGTDNPQNFAHEIYVHGGNIKFTFQGFAPGKSYHVHLGFAELFYSSAGKRKQHGFINGSQVLEHFDICGEAGPNTAVVKTFNVDADQNGNIEILLETSNNNCADICNIHIEGTDISALFVAGNDFVEVTENNKTTKKEVTIV